MPIPHGSEVAAWQLSFPTLGPSETMEGTVRDTGGARGTTGVQTAQCGWQVARKTTHVFGSVVHLPLSGRRW